MTTLLPACALVPVVAGEVDPFPPRKPSRTSTQLYKRAMTMNVMALLQTRVSFMMNVTRNLFSVATN